MKLLYSIFIWWGGEYHEWINIEQPVTYEECRDIHLPEIINVKLEDLYMKYGKDFEDIQGICVPPDNVDPETGEYVPNYDRGPYDPIRTE